MKKPRYSAKKEDATVILSIIIKYHCAYLDKDIEKEVPLSNFEGWEAECDLCGSHSGVSVRVDCECGSYHTFSVGDH